jgi:hypothetical protein
MEYVLNDDTLYKFVEYARNVWQINGTDDQVIAQEGIEKTREFFTHLGMPQKLRDVGVKQDTLARMAEKAIKHGAVGKFKKLEKNDVLAILKKAF